MKIFYWLLLFLPFAARADYLIDSDLKVKTNSKVSDFSAAAGLRPSSITNLAAQLITAFLSLLAVIFIILIILAGYNWMTAGGEEEKVNKAKQMIYRAIIGLLIIMSAYAITYFVFTNLPAGTGGGGGGGVFSL